MSLFQVFYLERTGNIHGTNVKAKANKASKKDRAYFLFSFYLKLFFFLNSLHTNQTDLMEVTMETFYDQNLNIFIIKLSKNNIA